MVQEVLTFLPEDDTPIVETEEILIAPIRTGVAEFEIPKDIPDFEIEFSVSTEDDFADILSETRPDRVGGYIGNHVSNNLVTAGLSRYCGGDAVSFRSVTR